MTLFWPGLFLVLNFPGLLASPPENTTKEQAGETNPQVEPRPQEKRCHSKNWREHWKSLPKEERRELRKLHKALKELRPEVRKRILERLHHMEPQDRRQAIARAREEVSRRILRRDSIEIFRKGLREVLPESLKKEIEGLSRDERKEILHEHFAEKRRKMIEELPAPLRDRVKGLSTRKQIRFITGYRAQKLLEKTLKGEEFRRVVKAGPEELRSLLVAGSEERPSLLSESTWERWVELKPYQQAMAVLRILHLQKERNAEETRKRGGGSHRHPRPRPADSDPVERDAQNQK